MNKGIFYTKKVVLIALFGALLSTLKLLLSFLPNIEIITLLIVAFTYVFGIALSMGATLVFCLLEILIWGFNPSWLISYLLHWPTVVMVSFLLKKSKINRPVFIAITLSVITALFGIQSTFIYMLTGGGIKANFFDRFIALYLSGIKFYIVHIASCFVSILFGFKPFIQMLTKLGKMYLPKTNIEK